VTLDESGNIGRGLGSRLAEETTVRPKPMVEIGGMPMLWHIMKIYDHWGYHDFCVALGYKGDYIKRWFRDYYIVGSSMTVNTRSGKVIDYPDASRPEWNVDLVETGRKNDDRRSHQAPRALARRRYGAGDMERRRGRHPYPQAARIPPFARQARDHDGGPPAGALRASGAQGRPDHEL
jgi:hypothetical protein